MLALISLLHIVQEVAYSMETVTTSGNLPSADWIQLIFEIVGTILGFGLAIWGERIADRIKARNDANLLRRLIVEELKKVYEDLNMFNEKTLDIQPLKIPSWESIINTGQVSLFDLEMREKLFRVYNTIREFNSWCLVHTNYYFQNEQRNQLLIKELNRIKRELLSEESNDKTPSVSDLIAKLTTKGRK